MKIRQYAVLGENKNMYQGETSDCSAVLVAVKSSKAGRTDAETEATIL